MFTRFFSVFGKLKVLKTHGRLMWHAFRHAETPVWIKGFMVAVVAYLLSPIDLVPDFLVLLGITDDLLVVTGAAWFLGKVIPERVRASLPAPQPGPTPLRTRGQRSRLKTLGILLGLVLMVAALVNHEQISTWLRSI